MSTPGTDERDGHPGVGLVREALLGPLSLDGWRARTLGVCVTVVLTVLTQIGGAALWPAWGLVFRSTGGRRGFKRRALRFGALSSVYLTFTLAIVPPVAELTGRTRLPIFATTKSPIGPLSVFYPLLNRTYVRPHTHEAFVHASMAAAHQHPGMVIRYLDAGFPFPITPLLPHLSHRDGQRIDVAFQFQRDGRYVDRALSPIGYFGYVKESGVRRECDGVLKRIGPLQLDLRWDFEWIQPAWPDLQLDVQKNRAVFAELAKDPRVCSILLEPTLHERLAARKLRSNPCTVARHDDHFHVTIRRSCKR